MKRTTILATGILALTLGSMAQAATVVHITGSTAFRKYTVASIEALFLLGPGGGNYVGSGTVASPTGSAISAGKYKCTYEASSASSGGEQGATYTVLEGTIAGFGANNPVIFKCSWSGSTGGLITTSNAINVTATNSKGWMSATGATGSECTAVSDANCLQVASGTYTGDGDAQVIPDTTMADSLQTSAGISGLVAGGSYGGKVGVIPFNWVACSGVTGPVMFTGCSSNALTNTITYSNAYDTTQGVGNNVAATTGQISALVGQVLGGPSINRNDVITAINTSTKVITITHNNTSATNLSAQTYVGATFATCPITNVTPNQAQQLLGGGCLLSQWTGNTADNGTAVYASGRNFDSGTRLSELSETGVGVFGGVQQVCPTFINGQSFPIAFSNAGTTGTALAGSNNASGSPALYVVNMDLWAPESIYPTPYTKSYTLGNSGYNGGGALAGALSTPGWTTAAPSPNYGGTGQYGAAPLYDSNNSGSSTGGWVIGYLGRPDAITACKATVGANTAHRVTFNGYADWINAASVVGDTSDSGMNAAGNATGTANSGFYDAAIQEGLYQCWETEYLYKYSGSSAAQKSASDSLANQIYGTNPTGIGIQVTTMHVSKSIEGGTISHN
jgi:hypothetical protein